MELYNRSIPSLASKGLNPCVRCRSHSTPNSAVHQHQATAIAVGPNKSTVKKLHRDRRSISRDRRRYSWRTITYGGLKGIGRRRAPRRDKENAYLDCFDMKLVYAGLTLMILSYLDAFFTLMLVGKGAYEANLFMAYILELGDHLFLLSKILLTSFGVLILVMHGNFYIRGLVKVERALHCLVSIYGLLIVWEIFMLGKI